MWFNTPEARKTLVLLTACVVVLGFVTYVLFERHSTRNDDVAVLLAPSESAEYTDRNGNPIDLEKLRGVPLVVNAWASWSPYSANELPALSILKSEFGDSIEIIAVNRMEPRATIEAYLSTIGNTDGIIFVNDSNDHFFGSVMGYAMPETLFYNADGDLVEHVRGTLSLEEFKEKIVALLQVNN